MGKIALLVALCLGWVASVRAAAPEPLPTTEELHKLYDDGQYQPLVQKLMRVLQLKGTAAQPYDRVELLMLRGEALLKLKQQAPAIEAFNSAAKEATGAQTGAANAPVTLPRKPEQVALARATALLVQHSQMFAYTPKVVGASAKKSPISLLDPAVRPDAFTALYTDLTAEMTAKAKVAARSTTLQPIIDAIKSLGDFRAVEMVSTKATTNSDAMLKDVATQASKLMGDAADKMGPRVDAISQKAHTKQRHENHDTQKTGTGTYTTTVSVTYTMTGLLTTEQRELKGIMTTCEQIVLACRDFEEVSAAAESAQFKLVEAKALKAGTHANETLNEDYSVVTTR